MYKIIISITLLLFLFSCKSAVGDSCTESQDCDTSLTCEKSFPNGYCIKVRCELNDSESCPDEAQCTYLKESSSAYCLRKCNENSDCREKYECKAVTNHKFRVCLPR